MKFQLNVYGAPWSGNSASQAIRLAHNLLKEGHEILRVFFFFDGVYHGLLTQSPASDEFPLLQQWQQLSEQNVELLLCIAASANRGILNDQEAERYAQPISTMAPQFELTGLGQWASGFHDADRIVTFK